MQLSLPPLLYKPRHQRQVEVGESWDRAKLLCLTGCAGSGKTTGPIFHALKDLLAGRIDKILVGRPAVTVGEQHGFLPGTLEEKLGPWLGAFADVIGDKNWAAYRSTLNIEPIAVGMSRGRTVKRSVCIIEECQNLTRSQLRLLATRVGSGGKLVLCGDIDQCDLDYPSPLDSFCDRMYGVTGFKEIRFLPDDVKKCRGTFCYDAGIALDGW